MADRKLSASTALTGAQVDAANDQIMILDVSDTTDGAGGTNKKITVGTEFLKLFRSYFRNVADTFTSIFTNSNTAARTYTFQDRDGTISDAVFVDRIKSTRLHGPVLLQAPTTQAGTINQLRAIPFIVNQTITTDLIACEVTIGTTGNVRLGIYNDNGSGYPNALLFDSGSIAISAPGTKSAAISPAIVLKPGLYWLVLNVDTANTFRVVNVTNYTLDGWIVFGRPTTLDSSTNNAYFKSVTYGAFTDPFPSGASVGSLAPAYIAISSI